MTHPTQSGHGMGRKFFGNVAVRAVFQVFSAFAGLLLLPILLRALGSEGYGVWSQIGVTVTLFAPMLTLRLDDALTRYLAGLSTAEERSQAFFSSLTAVGLLVSATVLVGLPLRGQLSSAMFADSSFAGLVPLFLARLALRASFSLVAAYYRARSYIRLSTSLQGLMTVAELAGMYLILIVAGGGVADALLYLACLDGLMILLVIGDVLRRERRVAISSRVLRRFLRYSLPLIPTVFLYWIVNSSDRYVIVHFIGLKEAGVYSAAYSLSQVVKILVMPISFVLLPEVSALWERGQKHESERRIAYSLRLYLLVAMPAMAGIAAVGAQLLVLMGTSQFAVDASLLALLAAGELCVGIYQIYVYRILLREKTWLLTIVFAVLAGLNLVLNFILVPVMGILGAAAATFASYALQAVFVLAFGRKVLGMAIEPSWLARVALASGCIYGLASLMPGSGLVGLVGRVLGGVVLYGILVFALGIVKREEVRSLLSR